MRNAYIFDAIRTPRGKARPDGGLHDLSPLDLLDTLYHALQARNNLDPAAVGDVVLGCVTQHGEQAANIAKTSTLSAGWSSQISGITVNRFCSSGLDAINLAALKVAAGQDDMTVAGGVEMMSRVPMLADKAAAFIDLSVAARCQLLMMGSGADLIASLYDVSREQADAIAVDSQQKAARARANGWFKSIIPIENSTKAINVAADECIRPQVTLESLAAMEPSFAAIGAKGVDEAQLQAYPQLREIHHIHTAGNSPAMADAAALLLIGDESCQQILGKNPRARIRAAVNANDDPMLVLSGCVAATKKLLERNNLSAADVDLFEIHEAFAATMVKCQKELDISDEKLNVNGGVIALGHPLGATGAIMAGTLLDELERRDRSLGVVAASGAAGAGTAMLIERI
ncbi:MAG: acetyl-CoA C-acyltransferase [Pseudomonadales bacterium]